MPLAASVPITLSQIVTESWLIGTVPVGTPAGPAATGGGTYTGSADAVYEIEITSVAAPPDSFRWRKNGGAWTTGVSTTDASPIALSDGITVTFTTPGTFGHDIGDAWTITVRQEGQGASFTLTAGGYSEHPAEFTLSVDRSLFLAFYARVRLTRPDVYVGGYLMANLVETVSIEESIEDPIQYATFTLSDKRVAYFDDASLSAGTRDVGIDIWIGPPGGVLCWAYAFVGDTESASNTMPYRPRGQFRSVSRAAAWADVQGCLNVPAMSGLTRGQILAAVAETAGVEIVNAAQLGGARVTKKQDINATVMDLLREFGEIEGWIARPVRIPQSGAPSLVGLEIISEDRVLDGEPVFEFDESNTFDVPETCPDRPVTDWVLSTTRLSSTPAPPETSTGGGGGGGVSGTGGGGVGPQGPPGPAGPSGVPTLLTSTGGSPTITGTIDGAAVAFTTSVNVSVASYWHVYVDGAQDWDATWTGTTVTTSSAPIGSVRIEYWSA